MAEHNTSTTCYADYTVHLKTVNILRTAAAAVSTAFCLLAFIVACITCCRRRWNKSYSNRLILIFLFAALLYSFATVFQWVRLQSDDTEPHGGPWYRCQLVGFLVEHFSWTLILMTFFLIYYLFSIVFRDKLEAVVDSEKFMCACSMRRKHKKCRKACCLGAFCSGSGQKLQYSQLTVAFVVSFIGPLLITWIPFVPGIEAYGLSGYWCWIEICDTNGNRYITGYVLQGVLWYGPIFLVAIFIAVLIVLVFYGLRKKKEEMGDRTKIEAFPLLFYPFVFLVFNVFAFANRLAVAIVGRPLYVLAILHSIIDPLWGTFASLTFFVYIGVVCCTEYRESRNKNSDNKMHASLTEYESLTLN